MKIALCSKGAFSLELGATKNRIELAESLIKLGWEAQLIDNTVLGISASQGGDVNLYSLVLRDYLIEHAGKYDVVLYEYATLPYDRKLFDPRTLFVARPAILGYRLLDTKYKYNFKAKLSKFYKSTRALFTGAEAAKKKYAAKIDYCLEQCDVIQIQNTKDRRLLIERGFDKNKIMMIPNGITRGRLEQFATYQSDLSGPLTVVYVGTFDFRKGAMDFADVFNEILKKFKHARLKLLGTSGMFSTIEQVLDFFPKKHHEAIEVVPKFNALDLPALLQGCHVGIFPSYLESFGYGALEMMCAGIPVVGYDTPGPSDFLLPQLIVPLGKQMILAEKVISLLSDSELRIKLSKDAKSLVVNNYQWDDIAKEADSNYHFHTKRIRNEPMDYNLSN